MKRSGTPGSRYNHANQPRSGDTKRLVPTVPNTYTQLLFHVVFSTKNRERTLTDGKRDSLYKYIWGIHDKLNCHLYRIGAAGPVTVTRMLSLATIEERINEILQHKRDLFAQIIGENSAPPSLGLSQAEIFGLFNLRTPKGVIHAAA